MQTLKIADASQARSMNKYFNIKDSNVIDCSNCTDITTIIIFRFLRIEFDA
jgi:hypothetical protein